MAAVKNTKTNYNNVFSLIQEINNNIKYVDENANYVSSQNKNIYHEFKNISAFYDEFNTSIELEENIGKFRL
ncbi:Conserved hypothetical protein [Clostridium acetobutylicum EA 2018]|uniref:Uncharacterized protein n=1 Tax=Clostridium acetobutylicum (strain ATCC 824 / DSM 792 / JCM 1419 / IAM 19013 / LMG 5710 / NBRC 13948 / NRRL B-527 / VKM B-1787 / 2291 / W) TaxID=272562 RepID=Q97IE4_CLOAB|nr:Hypothetical protein CA_C1704 [Clostridium acetobutylicum ATCC 824]ADZ20754.1 Conserved hypothetical protein [Clostridium acetobutylicum EA 2018]AEI31950.1 hypothetical protein SMB_G1729 [Clostridium acetobutylicum DSM 1731]AWV82219.1 hypothetical protein DK921_07250 [Clostridium acetobutylicum]PSM07986.1 hypothetical protein C7T89_07250 [Clostridium sp. NJ4]